MGQPPWVQVELGEMVGGQLVPEDHWEFVEVGSSALDGNVSWWCGEGRAWDEIGCN